MPAKPPTWRPPGSPSPAEQKRAHDAKRAVEQPWRAWYSLPVWRHPVHGLRAQQLHRQPLCETCLAFDPPRVTAATVVHHKRDHKGDWSLFVDAANLASACQPCHDRDLQSRGRRTGPT